MNACLDAVARDADQLEKLDVSLNAVARDADELERSNANLDAVGKAQVNEGDFWSDMAMETQQDFSTGLDKVRGGGNFDDDDVDEEEAFLREHHAGDKPALPALVAPPVSPAVPNRTQRKIVKARLITAVRLETLVPL